MSQANSTIALVLPLAAVNHVLSVLAQRPYAEVAGLITDIRRQTQQQLEAPTDLPAAPVKTEEAPNG